MLKLKLLVVQDPEPLKPIQNLSPNNVKLILCMIYFTNKNIDPVF